METDKVRQAFEQLDRVKQLRARSDCSAAEAQERDSELDDLWEGFRAGAAYAQSAAPTPIVPELSLCPQCRTTDNRPCFICGRITNRTSSGIDDRPKPLLYRGGNGKSRMYCMRCVLDAVAKAEDEKLTPPAELLPCPFCGESPKLTVETGDDLSGFFIRCEGMKCHVNPNCFNSRKDLVIADWNRRGGR